MLPCCLWIADVFPLMYSTTLHTPGKQSPVCCYVLQVNASGKQVLVEHPESAAVTPSRSVQVGMQPTLEVAVNLPQQAQPAHSAMQSQEPPAGNNTWSRVSDSTLTYELIERSLRQRGELTALAFVLLICTTDGMLKSCQ